MAVGVPREAGAAAPGAAPGPDPARKGWTAGRIAALVAGLILVLACIALLGGAGVLTWADQQGNYLATGTATYSAGGYALASDPVHLHGRWGWLGRFAGDVRIRVTAGDPGTPAFVGIGPASDVSRYLSGTSYTSVTALGDHDLTQHLGSMVPPPPVSALEWAAQVSGAGTQTLRWTVRSGDWAVVVMNADGAPGVTVRADVGLTSPVLPAFAGGLLAAGLTAGLIGAALVVASARLAASGT